MRIIDRLLANVPKRSVFMGEAEGVLRGMNYTYAYQKPEGEHALFRSARSTLVRLSHTATLYQKRELMEFQTWEHLNECQQGQTRGKRLEPHSFAPAPISIGFMDI